MSTMSVALKRKLAESLKQFPLERGEIRGIEGMGSHFFSFESQYNGRDHLFAGEVNGRTIYVYKVAEEATEVS